MRTVVKSLLVFVFAYAHCALAAQNPLYQTCATCHGADAQGIASMGAPALAGQQAAYLSRQLVQFRDGARGADAGDVYGAQMRAMSLSLTDAQIEALADYLAQLPVAQVQQGPEERASASLRNGSDYYQSSCGACHGGKAQGNPALNAPNLVMLDAAYLKRQMAHFQSGRRGSSAGDRYGKQMQLMSNTLPDAAHLDDVIGFIGSLSNGAVQE